MSLTYSGSGEILALKNVRTFGSEAYEKRLAPVLFEDFKGDTIPFALTGCQTSADGLVCNAFAKAIYNHGTAIDYQKAVGTFIHKSGAVYGLGMGATLAYVSETNFIVARNYNGSDTTSPTASSTESITFDMIADESYTITLEKRATTAIATLCRLKTNEIVQITIADIGTLCLGSPYIAVFTGTNLLVTGLSYFAPLFEHSRCLIVGDSITEQNTRPAEPEARTAWLLMQNYFNGDAVISGVGYATTATCKARVDAMLAMGYAFDTVFFCSGTNDGNANYPDTSYYQSIVDELTAKGIRVIWGIPPMRSSYETSDKMPRIRSNILAVTGCGFVRFDWATQDANGDPDASLFVDGTHPNATGYAKMYAFAVKEFEAMGV